MSSHDYAIIDIGSNTIRLVIYHRNKSGRFKEIENVKAVARLRNDLEDSGELNESGIQSLVKILKTFKEVTDSYNLDQLVCVATATIRQATNQDAIVTKVKQEIGYNMRILSEQEEAYYGYLAVVHSTSLSEGITIDIGGGSTEVTYFHDRRIQHSYSFPFGALTLKNMFVRGNIPTKHEMMRLRHFLKDQFRSLPWLIGRQVPLIGIGGSARNLAQVDQSLKEYPLAGLHQYSIKDHDIQFIKHYIMTLSFKELQKVEGLSKDRADSILPAIEVFDCLYDIVESNSFVLSRKGLREGVFNEQLTTDFGLSVFPNVIEESFNELGADFDINYNHVGKATEIALNIFQELRMSGDTDCSFTDEDLNLLKRGAFVFNLGGYIDSESSAQHTFYILANRTIDGLFHKDRLKVALIASYKSKSIFKQFLHPYKHWFSKEEKKKLRLLGATTKFSYCLDSTRRGIVEDIRVSIQEDALQIEVYCNQEYMPEEYEVEKQKKHLEKAIKRNVHVCFRPYEG